MHHRYVHAVAQLLTGSVHAQSPTCIVRNIRRVYLKQIDARLPRPASRGAGCLRRASAVELAPACRNTSSRQYIWTVHCASYDTIDVAPHGCQPVLGDPRVSSGIIVSVYPRLACSTAGVVYHITCHWELATVRPAAAAIAATDTGHWQGACRCRSPAPPVEVEGSARTSS